MLEPNFAIKFQIIIATIHLKLL